MKYKCYLLWLVSLALCGCGDNDVKYYEVAADRPAKTDQKSVKKDSIESQSGLPEGHPPIDANTMPSLDSPLINQNDSQRLALGLEWSVPNNWKPGKVSSMRVGSFVATGKMGKSADISVTAFPGAVGGILNNVNRWRSQISLPPILENALETKTVQTNYRSFTIVNLENPNHSNGSLSLTAAITTHGGKSWFIKIMGSSEIVKRELNNYMQFIQSFHFKGDTNS